MKQKVVIKALMNCAKCRTKAMKIVAVADGVEIVSIKGDIKNQIEVIGDKVDAAALTKRLRKKMGQAELLSVSTAGGEKKEDNDNNGSGGDDDDNNGSGGGKNNKKGSDHDGNGDKNKSGYGDGGGETKGKNMDFMGKAGFGYGYAYHAGNENEYPVGQLQCAQEVWSSEPKCLFYHAIMIS